MKNKMKLPPGLTVQPISAYDRKLYVYWKCQYKGVSYRLRDRVMIDHLERKGRNGRYEEWMRVTNEEMAIDVIVKGAV